MRIVVDEYLPPEISHCWREDWLSRFESAYGLFSKLAILNAFHARDIAQRTAAYGTGKRTKIIAQPNVDLLDSRYFDIRSMARIFRCAESEIARSFVYPQFDPREFIAGKSLRLCPVCAQHGYHAAIFQLDLVARCPIHGKPIVDQCPNCKRPIPYRLSQRVFAAPFTCPKCHHDLAPDLRALDTKSVAISEQDAARIEDVIVLAALKQKLFSVDIDLKRHFAFHNCGDVLISRPALQRIKADYFNFIEAIVLQFKTAPSEAVHATGAIPTVIIHTGFIPESRRGGRRSSATGVLPRRTRPWLFWDDKYWAMRPIYASVRRHLWRHIIHRHRRCVVKAARHLWWNVVEDKTVEICPVAYAFLQWRMFWEGFGTPRHVFERPHLPPSRVLAWLSDNAPYCPREWPINVQEWVVHRVFAMDCFNSFKEWSDIAQHQHQKNGAQFEWSHRLCVGHALTYWAISGKARKGDPLILLC